MDRSKLNKHLPVLLSIFVMVLVMSGSDLFVYKAMSQQAEKERATTEEKFREMQNILKTKKEASALPEKNAEAVVTELVGKYLKNVGGNYSEYYTDTFKKEFESEGISPIVFAQDIPSTYKVLFSEIAGDNQSAKVIVNYNFGENSVSNWSVLFKLKNENGNWLIDDTVNLR